VSPDLLTIENVSYAYRINGWQLEDISLEVTAGQIVGVIGPNGSGKSTLLRIAAGTMPCHSGQIRLMGEDIETLSRRKIARQLGYLPQNVTTTFDHRVEEIVAMGRYPHLSGAGFLQSHDLKLIDRCLEQTETITYRHRPLSQLSGGERQRVLLASVLAQQPQVLLLDEPTTGLDLHHQVTFFCLLSELVQKGMAVVVVTHELNLAAQYCDRLLLLDAGRTVKEGSITEVINTQVLAEVYHHHIFIAQHPITKKPIVLPISENQEKTAIRGDNV
jgi:iron complex transport system ATP-binding protein